MPFELREFTEVRCLDVRTLARKDRQTDDPAGAQLLVRSLMPWSACSLFDQRLGTMLYEKSTAPKQGQLEGMEGVQRTALAERVRRLPWIYEQTGCTVELDIGIGGRSNITLNDCRVHRVSLTPKEAGPEGLWAIDAPALTDATRGKLTGLKATTFNLTQLLPEVDDSQTDIEDPPAPKRGRKAAAQTPEQALAASTVQ